MANTQRQSNMELLRVISMFMVLMVHANFWAIGSPSTTETHEYMGPSFMRFLLESISIVCVNVFILLSGWFGIRSSLKGFGKFLFQCLFFLVGIYVIGLLTGWATLSVRGIAECFCMTELNWFIKAYIGLYILSPVLNAFTEHATKKQFKNTLLFFYLFQTLYAWISNGAVFFESGYSTLSFVGLYLLARYVKIYPFKFSGGGYLLLMTVNTLIAYTATYMGFAEISEKFYKYTNPLVILAAFGLLLYFSKLSFQSKFINWIGASSFAVFLFHTNPNIVEHFRQYVYSIYNSTAGLGTLAVIFLFLTAIYILAILFDQVRILLWKYIIKIQEKFFSSKTVYDDIS